MKQYPKIPYFDQAPLNSQCYAFDKFDGSNIRACWSKKRSWYKFGTRNTMINSMDHNFGDAIPIFLNKYGDELQKVFRDKKEYRNIDNFVVFGEYYGENSFVGQHEQDDVKDIVLFDVNQFRRGFIPPKEFIDNFGHLHIPEVVYSGPFTMDLVKDIRKDVYELKEGVIVKGVRKTKGKDEVWMAKIKTNIWLDKVKCRLGEKALLEEVNGNIKLLL